MDENKALVGLYESMAKIEAENSKRWHKQLILSNIIWAIVLVIVTAGLILAHFVYESQFEVVDEVEETTITQENDNGNNVYQPGENAVYNEGGD